MEGAVRKMPTGTLTYLERNMITGEENAHKILIFY